MFEQVTIEVETDPEAETNPGTESTERTLGRLEAETDQLAEEVEEAQTIAEEAQTAAESAEDRAENAAEIAWDAKAEIYKLREELPGIVSEILTQLQNEEEDGQDEIEEIQLPEETEAEPMPEVRTSRIPGWLI